MAVRLISSPGADYLNEVRTALADADEFIWLTAFVTAAGLELVAPQIEAVLARGGEGTLIVALDRGGFNAAPAFERALAWTKSQSFKFGIVSQDVGLLHAKALYTRSRSKGSQLLVGSANLTSLALGGNHELGVLLDTLPADLDRQFRYFVQSIAPKHLAGDDGRKFLEALGAIRAPRSGPNPAPPPHIRLHLN